MFRPTPLEQYTCAGHPVSVKREDLCAEPPMPPLSKMRGIQRYLERLKREGASAVGVMDTKVSKSGLGVAVISEALGLQCTYYFPAPQGDDWRTEWRCTAEQHGARLVPLPGGRIAIAYARAKAQDDGTMLPLGFPLYETVLATAEQVPQEAFGSIVVPCGTGTISSGVILGIAQAGPPPKRIVSVTASMDPAKAKRCARKHLGRALLEKRVDREALGSVLDRWQVVKEGTDYYAPEDTGRIPFPAHPYYEAKAWAWLTRNIGALPAPILFWNVGS